MARGTSAPAPLQAAAGFVPFIHVASVPRSVEFYRLLGFDVKNELVPDGAAEPVWAYLESGSAHLMLANASAPVVAEQQAVMFYLYVPDVQAMHTAVRDRGVAAGEMTYPSYCPKGEFRVEDPDGYCVMIAHT